MSAGYCRGCRARAVAPVISRRGALKTRPSPPLPHAIYHGQQGVRARWSAISYRRAVTGSSTNELWILMRGNKHEKMSCLKGRMRYVQTSKMEKLLSLGVRTSETTKQLRKMQQRRHLFCFHAFPVYLKFDELDLTFLHYVQVRKRI